MHANRPKLQAVEGHGAGLAKLLMKFAVDRDACEMPCYPVKQCTIQGKAKG